MSENKIEKVIETLNQTFEFYYENYPDIDDSDIWWTFDHDKKKYIHVCNVCEKTGDLATYYYRHGYGGIYVTLLQELFPEGTILNNDRHIIFFYQNEYYDAGGKMEPETIKDYRVTTAEDLERFLEFRENRSNIDLKNKMLEEGRKVLYENRSRGKKIEASK